MKSLHTMLIAILLIVAMPFFLFCDKEKNPIESQEKVVRYPEAEAQNMDSAVLEELVDEVKAGTYGDVHSLLIQRNDVMVLEEYFGENTKNTIHPIYSATKSVTSALIGIAIHQGKLSGIDEKMLKFFPEYEGAIGNLDSMKEAITIKNLLNMTAGFTWDEVSTSMYDSQNDVYKLQMSSDWIKYVLDLPMSDYPGSKFTYCCGATTLLSGILQKATGQTAADYAKTHLLEPLGIDQFDWSSERWGAGEISNTAWGLDMRPADMIKFGQLYLNNGRWNETQIVPEEWVQTSTAQSVKDIESASQFNATQKCDYAYQWWRFSDDHAVAGMIDPNDAYFAFGHGDQAIWVVPHLNLVAAMTSGNYDTYKAYPLFWTYVLKSVKDK
ncbi:serine hydrolase [candidate division KSB1 bacterium]|nr:serine hydrolase [candidate division KSB1 bacterium]